MKIFSTLLALGLALTAPAAGAHLPPADAWEIGPWVRGQNYSVDMPARPQPGPRGSIMFDFPSARGEVGALTTEVAPLAGARQITLRYRIDAARGTRFVASETSGETATISLYLQREGDNWSGRGRYASYRWYVPGRAVLPLTPGLHVVTVRLDEAWTNVNGQPNSTDARGFRAALEETARVGVAFGSSSRRSHGVYATAPARFTLLDLDIR